MNFTDKQRLDWIEDQLPWSPELTDTDPPKPALIHFIPKQGESYEGETLRAICDQQLAKELRQT